MDRNEFVNTLNLDLDEPGKAKRRLGVRQFGTTISGGLGTIAGSFVFTTIAGAGAEPPFKTHHIFLERQNTPTLYRISGTYITSLITTATVTIAVGDTSTFAASGTIEIEGDLITYTGVTATSFTGCSGIRVTHLAFGPVHQTASVGATTIDARTGVYFCVLGEKCFLGGENLNYFDGSGLTDVSDSDEPTAIFHTVYRSRIYNAGRAEPNRIFYSDAGDGTSWTSTNFFKVEDDTGEFITGLKELNDRLLIFKTNSIFTYDEIQLKQNLVHVGAYNHEVVHKIDDQIYTFCPNGVFITNGYSAVKISDPI